MATPRSPATKAVQLALVAIGLGMTLIVGLVGTPFWCGVRVLLVGAVVWRLVAIARHRSPKAVAAGSALAGIVTTAIGAAIGFPYLTKTGWSLRAAAGLLTTAGGVTLLAIGLIITMRSLRGWRRGLPVLAALLMAYLLGEPLVVAVAATNVPRPALGRITPADRGLAFEDARFTTSDGVSLSGWYIPSGNGAAVVLLHGASSTRANVLDQAAVLARHGYGVLLFDARGMGRSGGRAMNLGWHGDRDVAAAVTYLQSRPGVDARRIGAVGESMGGEEVIGAMAADPRIQVVVAEGATNRVSGDWAWLSGSHGWRGTVDRGVHRLTQAFTDLLTGASPPRTLRSAAASAAPRPILLIAAGRVADEAKAGAAIRAVSPASVQLWVVPGSAHVGGLQAQPAEWEQRVTAFLDAVLAKPA